MSNITEQSHINIYKYKIVNINSIKSLYITICYNEIEIGRATGFAINNNNDYYLIKNRHVVTGRNNETGDCLDANCSIPNKLKVWLPFRAVNGIHWDNRNINLYNDKEEKNWLEHPVYKEKVDVVALKLNNYNQNIFCYHSISNYNPIVTENVYIVGYPFGFNVNPQIGKYAIWSTGIVANDPDLNLNINGNQLPAFLVDAKTRHGQSGSPVLYYSDNGMERHDNGFAIYNGSITHELGICSGRINKNSDLGYVWKWSLIEEIIENIDTRTNV